MRYEDNDDGDGRRQQWQRATTVMATVDDDNDVNGDSATGNEVDDHGDGATGDNYDNDDDGDHDNNDDGDSDGDMAMGNGTTRYDDNDYGDS
jgi:hypothetical protein